jgi:hypothetical protein
MGGLTERTIADACLLSICCLWPGIWAVVAFNVGRHGGRGWLRLIVARLKLWGGAND